MIPKDPLKELALADAVDGVDPLEEMDRWTEDCDAAMERVVKSGGCYHWIPEGFQREPIDS